MGTEVELGAGYIETFAGNGKARSTGDGKLSTKAGVPLPHDVTVDKDERYLYFAESGSDRVRRIDLKEGTLHNFAGIGETCYSGDSGLCGEAGLYLPLGVAFRLPQQSLCVRFRQQSDPSGGSRDGHHYHRRRNGTIRVQW